MSFWRSISTPRRAAVDFAEHWKQPTPHRWQVLGVAMALTFAMIMLAIPESQRIPPAKPDVTYITTLAPDRTLAEIEASNIANQARKDRRAALLAEREERRRENFRALGRATFLDVDALEKQFSEDPEPAPSAAPRSATPAQQ